MATCGHMRALPSHRIESQLASYMAETAIKFIRDDFRRHVEVNSLPVFVSLSPA